jgi:flagellar biogenesis protein FliO
VTLLVNLIMFAAIALVPLGISYVFMRLRRKFSSYS